MSDGFIFVFGLLATIFALGPLIIAAISEAREKNDREHGGKAR